MAASPFGSVPAPPAGAAANPFAKADSPANPFAPKMDTSSADDEAKDDNDDAAEPKQMAASPFGSVPAPPAGAAANPFAKTNSPTNSFSSASSTPPSTDTNTSNGTNSDSVPPKPLSPFGLPPSTPFGMASKSSDSPEGEKSSSPFGAPPLVSSNPFGSPNPTAASSDAVATANPLGATTPPSPGLANFPPSPVSSELPVQEDAKSADPFAFFAAPPPTMEEVEFIDPFGKDRADTAPQTGGDDSAEISRRLAAERLEAKRLDAELAAAEEKEAQEALQRQSAARTDQAMDDLSDADTFTGNADDDVEEEGEEEDDDDVQFEITPDDIDQIRNWDPVSFSWRVGARHFMSNDDFRSLSSTVEMGYGHGFFLRLHLQGPRAGVELRIGDISADLVMRNMAIFLHCRDQYGQRIVAHAVALENGSCASDDDLNSFGCCPFVYENDDGVVMEVSRQMLYQQAKGSGLRIEGFFDVGAVSPSYR